MSLGDQWVKVGILRREQDDVSYIPRLMRSKDGSSEAVPKSITYRAMSPLYMGEPYRILLSEGEQGSGWNADIWDSYGKQSMKGTIKE